MPEENSPSMSGASTSAAQAVAVRQALRAVVDPELGANVVDLNMVRRVDVQEDRAEIDLVLSVPDCPLVGWLAEQARRAALSVPGIGAATVRILDEPWQPPGEAAGWRDWVTGALGDGD
jgi:metal-sulfur cluster biosynthetic enzyme